MEARKRLPRMSADDDDVHGGFVIAIRRANQQTGAAARDRQPATCQHKHATDNDRGNG